MTANSPASPEGSILTSNGWVIGKVEFAGLSLAPEPVSSSSMRI
jgi:hypothetical protein